MLWKFQHSIRFHSHARSWNFWTTKESQKVWNRLENTARKNNAKTLRNFTKSSSLKDRSLQIVNSFLVFPPYTLQITTIFYQVFKRCYSTNTITKNLPTLQVAGYLMYRTIICSKDITIIVPRLLLIICLCTIITIKQSASTSDSTLVRSAVKLSSARPHFQRTWWSMRIFARSPVHTAGSVFTKSPICGNTLTRTPARNRTVVISAGNLSVSRRTL